MNAQILPEPKFNLNTIVAGKHYGRFAIMGRKWSEVVGEYLYGVVQVDSAGLKISKEMNLVESCFAEGGAA